MSYITLKPVKTFTNSFVSPWIFGSLSEIGAIFVFVTEMLHIRVKENGSQSPGRAIEKRKEVRDRSLFIAWGKGAEDFRGIT